MKRPNDWRLIDRQLINRQLIDRQPANGDAADAMLAMQAMSYVLGELPSPGQEAFEVRLIDDQALREAVVDAVRVCEAVTSLTADDDLFLSSLAVSKRTSVQTGADRFVAWGAVALAASVMAAVVVAGLNRAPSIVASGNTDPQARLALAWINTPSLSNSSSDETSEARSIDDDDVAVIGDSTDDEDDTGTSELVPTDDSNWLYEALTASRLPTVPPSTAQAIRGET